MTKHSDAWYDYNRNDPNRENPFTLTVDDDGILNLPDSLMKEMGWSEGDTLVWKEGGDGSFSLKKYAKDQHD